MFDRGEWFHPLATHLWAKEALAGLGQLELPVMPGGAARVRRRIARHLAARVSELTTDDDEQPKRSNATDLVALRSVLRAALKDNAPTPTKAVLHSPSRTSA